MLRGLCLFLVIVTSSLIANLALAQSSEPTTTPDEQIAKLKSENTKLKKEVSDAAQTISKLQTDLTESQQAQQKQQAQDKEQIQKLEAQVTQLQQVPAPVAASAPAGAMKALPIDATNAVATPAAPEAAGASGSSEAAPAGSRTYTVLKGDKIWTIAKRMYPGHTKEGVEKIQEANKDTLGTKPLKIGQVLIIPQ